MVVNAREILAYRFLFARGAAMNRQYSGFFEIRIDAAAVCDEIASFESAEEVPRKNSSPKPLTCTTQSAIVATQNDAYVQCPQYHKQNFDWHAD